MILCCLYLTSPLFSVHCASFRSRRKVWSSSTAVSGEELIQNDLQWIVDGHGVVLSQVVSAGWAGVHVGPERPLQTFLEERKHFPPLGTCHSCTAHWGTRECQYLNTWDILYKKSGSGRSDSLGHWCEMRLADQWMHLFWEYSNKIWVLITLCVPWFKCNLKWTQNTK